MALNNDTETTMSTTNHTMILTVFILFITGFSPTLRACEAEPLIGSVCLFAGNFCPKGYAEANGQLLSIAQNTALFSILGTTYGGDGQTTFALPDLRGRSPVGTGQGPGLSNLALGETAGAETVTLTQAQLPAHTHTATLRATNTEGSKAKPGGNVLAKLTGTKQYGPEPAAVDMAPTSISVGVTGGNQPINTRPPSLGMYYCIALQGIFPSRN